MTNTNRSATEDDLASAADRVLTSIEGLLRSPWVVSLAVIGVMLIVSSPLVVFFRSGAVAKEWSEILKNVVESAAVLIAVFALFKWVQERRDRATDVLLKLDEHFRSPEVVAGRGLVDRGDNDIPRDLSGEDTKKLDDLLRFYVVLYGVLHARQVPERSLSICFRYWLALYYRQNRTAFRAYVNEGYPTLRRWLDEDLRSGGRFFGAEELLKDKIEDGYRRRSQRRVKQ